MYLAPDGAELTDRIERLVVTLRELPFHESRCPPLRRLDDEERIDARGVSSSMSLPPTGFAKIVVKTGPLEGHELIVVEANKRM